MKKNLPFSAVIILVLLSLITTHETYSQTSGTFSFSVTTTSTGGYSPSHLLAIWIENGSAAFIKTKIRYSSNGNLDHLNTWDTKSGRNVVDAATGATLNSHGTITFLWNGTNVAGTLVPDGSYFTWLEMAWADNLVSGKTVNSYPFTKGAAVFHSTPANTANFSGIVLDWTPTITGIEGSLESKDVNVYPNPSTGILNIDFKLNAEECLLRIVNDAGQLVYNERITNLKSGVRTFDLTSLPSGIYYCTLHFPGKDIVFPLVITK